MPRLNHRASDQMRPVTIEPNFTDVPTASVMISFGKTKVWCVASVQESQPHWMKYDPQHKDMGWVTAEYSMMPGSTMPRSRREGRTGHVSGRTQEIQRLIGRSLRAITRLQDLGPRTLTLDCDVLQADGGTRTACITGAYVALAIAFHRLKAQDKIRTIPLIDNVVAVSAGLLKTRPYLDLNYVEDVAADVDMNFVMTGAGRFVEIQGTGEEATFSESELTQLIGLVKPCIKTLTQLQNEAIEQAIQNF